MASKDAALILFNNILGVVEKPGLYSSSQDNRFSKTTMKLLAADPARRVQHWGKQSMIAEPQHAQRAFPPSQQRSKQQRDSKFPILVGDRACVRRRARVQAMEDSLLPAIMSTCATLPSSISKPTKLQRYLLRRRRQHNNCVHDRPDCQQQPQLFEQLPQSPRQPTPPAPPSSPLHTIPPSRRDFSARPFFGVGGNTPTTPPSPSSSLAALLPTFSPPSPDIRTPFLRVRACAAFWKSIDTPPTVLSWILHGVRIPWIKSPLRPRWRQPYRAPSTAAAAAMDKELARGLDLGLLVVLQQQDLQRAVCHPIFLIPRPHSIDRFRLILDFRESDAAQHPPLPFALDQLRQLPYIASRGSYLTSIDLADAYGHLALHKHFRRHFAFTCNHAVSGDNRARTVCLAHTHVPFGWKHSPSLFVRFLRPLVAHLRRHSIRLIWYLDDFLLVSSSYDQALRDVQFVLEVFACAGLVVAHHKCTLTPTRRLVHLGTLVDLDNNTFSVPADRMRNTMSAAKSLACTAARNRRWVRGSLLASFIGQACSLLLAVQPALLFLRHLYLALGPAELAVKRDVKLPRAALEELSWWSQQLPSHASSPIWSPTLSATLTTDASSHSWGAVSSLSSVPAHGRFRGALRRDLHITSKEMSAVLLGCQTFQSDLRGRHIEIVTDSTCVFHAIRRWSSRSLQMHAILLALFRFLSKLQTTVEVRWTPTTNNVADMPSRWVNTEDLSLTFVARSLVRKAFGTPEVDLFASHRSKQAPVFVSRFHSEHTPFADAFSLDWPHFCHGRLAWIFPPLTLLDQVAARLVGSPIDAIVIAPWWPSAMWSPVLFTEDRELLFLPHDCVIARSFETRLPRSAHDWPWCAVRVRAAHQ